MKIFLDDTRIPSDIYGEGADEEWFLTCSPETVKECLLECEVTHLSLDNDLGHGVAEGHTLIVWMAEHNLWPSQELYVHSANPYWRKNMETDIQKLYYEGVRCNEQT